MRQNSHFRLPCCQRFFAKNRSYGYGDKLRWGPARVHLGVNGVPLGPKNGSKPHKITMPQNSNFRLPCDHRFFPKMEVTVMAPNHGWDPVGSILGPMGSHCVQKMSPKNLPCPKIQLFDYPAVIDFLHQMEVTVMATNHVGNPLGSILGPMGSHWVQKMGQNHKKLPCPKMRIFDYPAVIDFLQKLEVTVMAPNHGGDPLGSILGPMGFHWVQKMGQNDKKLPCPKIRIFDHHAIIDFLKKMEFTFFAASDGGDPVRFILGPMGSHWVKKMGQNRTKLPCPKIQIFDYAPIIDFSQKMEVTVMAPNRGGDSLGSIMGPMGPIGSKK